MIELKRPEGWDEYHETHYPLILTDQGGGVLWIPNGLGVELTTSHRSLEDELMEAMTSAIEED